MKTLKTRLAAMFIVSVFVIAGMNLIPARAADDPLAVSFDGLELVPESKADVAYIRPGTDFSGYNKLLILEPEVAFKKNWKRNHRNVKDKDMERMRQDLAELFQEVFTQELQTEGGYQIVEDAAEDVLLLRPAIIDLDVTAPDTMSAGRSRTFTNSAGAATLFVELFDSVSGEILARAVDREEARQSSTFRYTTRSSNKADARRMLARWADLLRDRLDEMRAVD